LLLFSLVELHLLAAAPFKDEDDGTKDNHLSADSEEGPKSSVFICNKGKTTKR
jgi:hypothetical protein